MTSPIDILFVEKAFKISFDAGERLKKSKELKLVWALGILPKENTNALNYRRPVIGWICKNVERNEKELIVKEYLHLTASQSFK